MKFEFSAFLFTMVNYKEICWRLTCVLIEKAKVVIYKYNKCKQEWHVILVPLNLIFKNISKVWWSPPNGISKQVLSIGKLGLGTYVATSQLLPWVKLKLKHLELLCFQCQLCSPKFGESPWKVLEMKPTLSARLLTRSMCENGQPLCSFERIPSGDEFYEQ